MNILNEAYIQITLNSISNNYVTDFGAKWIKIHSTSNIQMLFTNPYTYSN